MLGSSNAGKKDSRIVIQVATWARDAAGEVTATWATSSTVWAEVREQTGKEVFQSDQRAAQIDRVFVIRYISGLNQKDYRILYESDVYDIFEIVENGRRSGLTLRCTVHRDTSVNSGGD